MKISIQLVRSKVRGGVNLLAALEPSERAQGVAAASTGNHGQSVAYAARLFGCQATIFMPEGANPLKVAATEALGAEVVQTGRDFDAARLAAEEYADCHGMRFVHSSERTASGRRRGNGHARIARGGSRPATQSSFRLEGAAECSAPAWSPAPSTRQFGSIGVQAEGAPAVYRSWREGRRVVTENVATFAEGLATREPFAMPLALFPRLVDEIMLVSDDQIAQSIRLLVKTTRQVAEGAGAAALAAAMTRRSELAGTNVGLILSGGNITIEQLSRILNDQPP